MLRHVTAVVGRLHYDDEVSSALWSLSSSSDGGGINYENNSNRNNKRPQKQTTTTTTIRVHAYMLAKRRFRRLYFQTIVVWGVVFLLAGLANLDAIKYFRDGDYSNGQGLVDEEV